MSHEARPSMKKKSKSKSESPSRENQNALKKDSAAEGHGSKDNVESGGSKIDGVQTLPASSLEERSTFGSTSPTEDSILRKSGSLAGSEVKNVQSADEPILKSDETGNRKDKGSRTSRKGGSGTPRGGHQGSKSHRGEMKFGEKPSQMEETEPQDQEESHFDTSKYRRMSALYFHKYNDLSRSARGVGYHPDHAVPKYGPGVNDEAESLYGTCRLLKDFQYSTWTETVVPLRNHNVVQGFNEMILFLIKLAANPDGPVNHEEAFMATSFLANIRNDLGEHPPNVLALLEYIDFKTRDDGSEPADPDVEVMSPCKAAQRY